MSNMEHKPTPSKPGSEEMPSAASPEGLAEAIAKGYEPHDLKLRGVFVFIGVLSLTLIVVLAAIYAIMMALVEHDRSVEAVGSPVAIKMAPIYAPLQPSLGYNGDHDNDHDWLDQDDMLMMRQKVDKALKSQGTSSTGRRYISIASAIDQVIATNMLSVKPAVAPVVQPANPKDSWEGYTPNLDAAASRAIP